MAVVRSCRWINCSPVWRLRCY